MKRRIMSALLSAAVLFAMAVPVTAVSAGAVNTEPEIPVSSAGLSEETSDSGKTEHAYDPIGEAETEKAYRDSTNYVENKLIFSVKDVRKEGAKPVYLSDNSKLCKAHGLTDVSMVYESKTDENTFEVFYEARSTESDIWGLTDKLKGEDGFLSAEPDFIWTKADVGDYTAASAEEMARATHFSGLDVESIWSGLHQDNILPGQGVVVAVIDTGVDYNHEDLHEAMWVNNGEIPGNGIDDDGNGYVDDVYGYDFVENDGDPMDDHGHGTHVSGIIAMQPNFKGGVGLAYGAKIMAVKAGQATGYFASTDVAKAVRYAVNNGADVINMSFGGTGRSYLIEGALQDALATSVLVASAGNDTATTTDAPDYIPYPKENIYPGGYSYVLGVMATYNDGRLAGFSNWDWNIGANCEYEIAAPGVEIYSTLPNNRYACWSGTSMAAPNVAAAAAIIRSKYPDKSKYTSRYIMGQLVSATKDKTYWKYGQVYPVLNIKDSLRYQPKPRLLLTQFYMFDDPSISENNNGDGIAQPGETIDIALSAFNYWGTAKDVTITVDSVSDGGVPNPHVEYITDTTTLGEIGTFATGNNGWQYESEKLVGVSRPIRVKIREGTANDIQIPFYFHLTAKNGMDSTDTNTYTAKGSYMIIVQKGEKLSGVIREDMTLTADKYWIIENNVLIPEGVTVTVEPGTQIQFWSADPDNPYGANADVYLQVEGKFICEGTEDKPIEMFPGKGYETRPVCITGVVYSDYVWNITDNDYEKGYTKLSYVNIIEPGDRIVSSSGGTYKHFCATEVDHCRFVIDKSSEYDNKKYNSLYAKDLSYSIVESFSYSTLEELTYYSEKNKCEYVVFNTYCTLLDGAYTDTFRHSGSLKDSVVLNYRKGQHDRAAYYVDNYSLEIKNNAIFSNLNKYPIEAIRFVSTSQGHKSYDISGNYWGTTDPQIVKLQCYDADWDVSLCDLVQEPYLTLEDDMSDIYPFVTEAYLTDTDGNRISIVSGAQTVTMHVKFNRDMASDVQPMVTYGGSEPYTDYMLTGDWATPREWTSTFTLDPFINMGKMYIRVKGAAAADDKWLVTGNDAARFWFNVEKSTAQSMALQGSGASGINELTWMQDDYDTLAGYNIYRCDSYDSTKPVEEQSFIKLNNQLISNDECAYTDADVEQGKNYYYFFKVVDTAFKESPASNVIMCTPTDTEKPVITHTPIIAAVPDEQIAISASITDNVKVDSAVLYYRNGGSEEWKTAVMRKSQDHNTYYRAVISSYEVGTDPIEYYILANDGTNTETFGAPHEPIVIAVAEQHNYDDGIITKQPTCTEEGEKVYTCLDCGTVRTEALPKLDHVYDGGVYKKVPSCTEDGIKVYTCINCSDKKEETVKASGHNYTDNVVSPTCTEQGYTEHTCSKCGDHYKDTFTPTTQHRYMDEILQEAGCMNDGIIQHRCESCSKTVFETIPKTGHSFSETVVPPSCYTQGYTEHTCESCGYYYRDTYTKTTDHNYDDGVISVKPTYTQSGIMVYTCQDCGAVKMKTVPALELSPLVNNSVIAKSTIKAGNEASITASATGGTGSYTFAVYYRPETSDKWKNVQGYSSNTNISVLFNKAGSYQFSIKAKDSMGNVSRKYISVIVEPCPALVNESTLSAETIVKGQSVIVRAASTGGVGEKLYAVYYKKKISDKWTKAQGYSNNTALSLIPNAAKEYVVRVKVKDAAGKVVNKDIDLKVTVISNTSTISSDAVKLGETVNINASATGGLGTYSYAIYYKKHSSTSWTKKQRYSTNSDIKITLKTSTVYDISVKAKDETGAVSKKTFSVTVTKQ